MFKSTFRTSDDHGEEEEQEMIHIPNSSSLCDGGGKSTERKEK